MTKLPGTSDWVPVFYLRRKMNNMEEALFAYHKAIEAIKKQNEELLLILSPNKKGQFRRNAAEKGLDIAFSIQTLVEHGHFPEWIPERKTYDFKYVFGHIKYNVGRLYERRSKESLGGGTSVGEVPPAQTETKHT